MEGQEQNSNLHKKAEEAHHTPFIPLDSFSADTEFETKLKGFLKIVHDEQQFLDNVQYSKELNSDAVAKVRAEHSKIRDIADAEYHSLLKKNKAELTKHFKKNEIN